MGSFLGCRAGFSFPSGFFVRTDRFFQSPASRSSGRVFLDCHFCANPVAASGICRVSFGRCPRHFARRNFCGKPFEKRNSRFGCPDGGVLPDVFSSACSASDCLRRLRLLFPPRTASRMDSFPADFASALFVCGISDVHFCADGKDAGRAEDDGFVSKRENPLFCSGFRFYLVYSNLEYTN